MTEFYVTNARTGNSEWIAGATPADACRAAENARRELTGEQKIPATARASYYSEGSIIDVSIGDSYIKGRTGNVRR